jgi:toxin ParE1/3/4
VTSYRISRRANANLTDIYVFGVQHFGRPQALAYQVELEDCFAMLARHPKGCRTSPTIRPGLRRHEHGSHVILYREEKDGILIVAVLHSRSIRGLRL